jgi:crotonobetainyl-CoA:carnitine CoA-transferase CaiB-like acyl-CoA transferase
VSFCDLLGRPDLTRDPRFADVDARSRNEAELMGIVRPAIAEKPTAHWAERLKEADIMHERLNSFREFLVQPQTEAMNLIGWLKLAEAPEPIPLPNIAGIASFPDGTPRGTPPVLGQHTAEILREHGFAPADIAALVERGVISQA